MPNPKISILIVDDLHPCFFEQDFEGFEFTYLPNINAEDVPSALFNIHVLIVRSKVRVDEKLCINANKLQLVARAGSGVDNLDTDWLDSKGIKYINTPEANSLAVAEQTLGMLISLLANINKSNQEVKNKIWDREGNRGEELSGKTVGIIGFGHTGSQFAKLLGGFDVKILAYDKYKMGFGNFLVNETDMNQIMEEADIISLHIPLTSETKNLIDISFINRLKKPIHLLNLSRGPIANLNDVIIGLNNGKIKGLATDVLPNEKLNQLSEIELEQFNDLSNRSNVIITPHIGGWTRQSYVKISKSLAYKIREFYNLKPPLLDTINETILRDPTVP